MKTVNPFSSNNYLKEFIYNLLNIFIFLKIKQLPNLFINN